MYISFPFISFDYVYLFIFLGYIMPFTMIQLKRYAYIGDGHGDFTLRAKSTLTDSTSRLGVPVLDHFLDLQQSWNPESNPNNMNNVYLLYKRNIDTLFWVLSGIYLKSLWSYIIT